MFFVFFDDTVDGPAKSESPVENGGKHHIIYSVSSILLVVQDFARPSTVCYPNLWPNLGMLILLLSLFSIRKFISELPKF